MPLFFMGDVKLKDLDEFGDGVTCCIAAFLLRVNGMLIDGRNISLRLEGRWDLVEDTEAPRFLPRLLELVESPSGWAAGLLSLSADFRLLRRR